MKSVQITLLDRVRFFVHTLKKALRGLTETLLDRSVLFGRKVAGTVSEETVNEETEHLVLGRVIENPVCLIATCLTVGCRPALSLFLLEKLCSPQSFSTVSSDWVIITARLLF